MRIERINHSKQGSDTSSEIRLQPGQIVRGGILQLFPFDRARIQLGSFQFIAQLEASLEQGKMYYFQVADVKDEVHLRVIEQTHSHEENEWQQLLRYIGSKHSKVREQFIRQLLQSDIPFTKKSLQQVFTLLDHYPNQTEAINALKRMMKSEWPLTREIMESMIAYQTSTFTKEINNLYQSLSQNTQVNHVHRSLMEQVELLLPEVTRANETFRPLFNRVTTKESTYALQLLKWIHPQINKANIQTLIEMPVAERIQTIPTPSRMVDYLGVREPKNQQVFQQTLASISTNAPVFQKQVEQFLKTFERNIQLQAIHQSNNTIDAQTYHLIQESFMKILPTEQWTQTEQNLMRKLIPKNVNELLQMMVDLKGVKIQTVEQMIPSVNNLDQSTENKPITAEFMRAVQYVIQHLGLSYEHSLASEQTEERTNTLKGLLMQFIQEQGVSGERARHALQFIQGMQLQTVQETAHLMTVHLQIPAMIGHLHSDMHIEFESKKTRDNSIDPNYCRILFDLDLAALKRTLIDMHIQNKQVSFIVYNDFPYMKQIAQEFEPTLKSNLTKNGYEVSSIRYQPFNKNTEKQNLLTKSFERTEGFDVKV